jgi:hypothetical protein
MICSGAEQRLKVWRFWKRHGLIATQEAFASPAERCSHGKRSCAAVGGSSMY